MPQAADGILYSLGFSTGDLDRNVVDFKGKLANMEGAVESFSRDAGRKLAQSIDLKNFEPSLNRARQILTSLPKEATESFNRSLGPQASKQLFKPLLNEAETLSGKLKASLKGGFDISSIALGAAGGLGLASLGGALLNLGKDAVAFSAQFETALAKVATIADKGVDIGNLRGEIKKLATEVPQDIVGLAEGLFSIIGSGIKSTADALNVLEISAKAAVAGVSTTADASKAIVFILNGFQKSVGEAQHVSDVLFKTVDEGVIEFGQLANVVGDIAAPAASAGVSLEDVSAAIAAMTKGGIGAEETITGLRNAIKDIVSPSAGASAAAKSLGLNFSKAGIEAAGGFAPFLAQVEKAAKGDTAALSKLFPDARSLRALTQLTGSMADEFQRLAGQFGDLTQVSGATERAFQIMNATAENQFKLFKNNLANAVESLGHGLLEVLKPALVVINESFVDTAPIDKTIARMIELGASIDRVQFLELNKQLQQSRKDLDAHRAGLEETIKSYERLSTISAPGGPGGSAQVTVTARDTGVRLITEQIKEQLKTTAGLEEIEKRRLTIKAQLLEVDDLIGRAQLSHDDQTKSREDALVRTREKLDGELFAIDNLVKKQTELNAQTENEGKLRVKISALERFQRETKNEIRKEEADTQKAVEETEKNIAKAVKEKNTAEEARLRTQLVAQHALLDVANLFVPIEKKKTEETGKQLEANKEIAKLIANNAKQLELAAAATPFERELIGIKQHFADLREQAHGSLIALRQFAILEQNEIDKAINKILEVAAKDLFNKAGGENRFQAQVDAFNKKGTQAVEKIGAKIKKDAEDIDNETERLEALEKLRQRREQVAEQSAVDLADLIDRQLGDLTAGFIEFFAKINDAGASNFSIIIAGASLFNTILETQGSSIKNILGSLTKGLFGDSEKAARIAQSRIDAEARNQEEATLRLDDFAGALQKTIDALQGANILELEKQLAAVNAEIAELSGKNLQDSIDNLNRQRVSTQRMIDELLRLPSLSESQRIALEGLKKALVSIDAQIADLKSKQHELTSEEKEKLRLLEEQRKKIGEQLDLFGKLADNFDGLIDKLNLGFELLNIDDPVKKLAALQKAIQEKFKAIIPTTEVGIRKLIADGLAALEAGGATLVDFLKGLDLEELTADQFRDLLKLLNDLANQAKAKVDAIGGEVEDLNITAVRQITFTQGNKLIDETVTMRVIQTQILEIMRNAGGSKFALPELRNFTPAGANKNNIFIFNDGSFVQANETDLRPLNRRNMELAIAASRARGIN